MKEIEILVEVLDDVENVLKALDKFQYEGDKETIDVYYYDPLRDTLKPNSAGEINECLRVRTKNDLAYITYKVDKFDDNGKWLYSDEYETTIGDLVMLNKII